MTRGDLTRRSFLAGVSAVALTSSPASAGFLPFLGRSGGGVSVPPPPPPPPPPAAPENQIIITNQSGSAQTNYPWQFGRPFVEGEIPHFPQIVINSVPVATQADVKARHGDGSVRYALLACIIPSIPTSGALIVQFTDQLSGNNTPLSPAQMLAAGFDFDAVMSLSFTSGGTGTASARQMLEDSNFTWWTSGQIAQTIELADDTTARTYDIGSGDGFHPFRPRFYATFWPGINKVHVRFSGECNLTTELTDLFYDLELFTGHASPASVYTLSLTNGANQKKHWGRSIWTKRFWIGGEPEKKINIKHGVGYLAAARPFFFNYDPSINVSEAGITDLWNAFSAKTNDIWDGAWNGQGYIQSGMATTGGRPDLGIMPQWSAIWLYTGDWRVREMSYTLADQAGGWSACFRETKTGKRLLTTDPAGNSGLGHTISPADRPKCWLSSPAEYSYSGTPVDQRVTIVAAGLSATKYTYDGAHQPAYFYLEYVLSGDPWYLQMMYFWVTFQGLTYNYGKRGPTGGEMGILDQVRGTGRVLRNRVDAWCASPDGYPEKTLFATMINEAIAKWEGGFDITGTVFDGTAMKNWGVSQGNYYSSSALGGHAGEPPPQHNWEMQDGPSYTPAINAAEAHGCWVVGVVGGFASQWMELPALEGLSRAIECGFAGEPLLEWSLVFYYNAIQHSDEAARIAFGSNATCYFPTQNVAGVPMTIDDTVNTYSTYFRTTEFPAYWAAYRDSADRQLSASPFVCVALDKGIINATAVHNWWYTNVYSIANMTKDTRYSILPRV